MTVLRKLVFFTLLFILFLSTGSAATGNRLFLVEKNELYGYVNEKGDTLIDCIYPMAFTDTISSIGFVADDNGKIKCFNNVGRFLFYTFSFDNGPDYPEEGCFRIEDENGLIGFADTLGNVVISPRYKFAHPFSGGKAKVTDTGRRVVSQNGEHSVWESDKWYFVSRKKRK